LFHVVRLLAKPIYIPYLWSSKNTAWNGIKNFSPRIFSLTNQIKLTISTVIQWFPPFRLMTWAHEWYFVLDHYTSTSTKASKVTGSFVGLMCPVPFRCVFSCFQAKISAGLFLKPEADQSKPKNFTFSLSTGGRVRRVGGNENEFGSWLTNRNVMMMVVVIWRKMDFGRTMDIHTHNSREFFSSQFTYF